MKYTSIVEKPTALEWRLFRKIPPSRSLDRLITETYFTTTVDWFELRRTSVTQAREELRWTPDTVMAYVGPSYPKLSHWERSRQIATFDHFGVKWGLNAKIVYAGELADHIAICIVPLNKDLVKNRFYVVAGICLYPSKSGTQKKMVWKRDPYGTTDLGWTFDDFLSLDGFEVPFNYVNDDGKSQLSLYLRFELSDNPLYPISIPSKSNIQKLRNKSTMGDFVVEWNTYKDSYVSCPAFEFAGGLFRLFYSFSPPLLLLQRLPGGSASIKVGCEILVKSSIYAFEHEFAEGFSDYGITSGSLSRRNQFVVRLLHHIDHDPPHFDIVGAREEVDPPSYRRTVAR